MQLPGLPVGVRCRQQTQGPTALSDPVRTKVSVGLHVHLYVGLAVLAVSAVPFFLVIYLADPVDTSARVLVEALAAVALLHVALAIAARACSTEQLKFWDGLRLITAYMTIGVGGSAMLIATPSAMVALIASLTIATIGLVKREPTWAPHHYHRMIAFFHRHRMYQ